MVAAASGRLLGLLVSRERSSVPSNFPTLFHWHPIHCSTRIPRDPSRLLYRSTAVYPWTQDANPFSPPYRSPSQYPSAIVESGVLALHVGGIE